MSKLSFVSLANTALLFLLTLAVLLGWVQLTPIFTYTTHKFLHLSGVVLFLGNVLIGPLWVVLAQRSKEARVLRFSFEMLLLTDVIITLPAIDLTVLNGLYLAEYMGGVQAHYWLKHSVWDLMVLWVLVYPIHFIQEKLYVFICAGETGSKAYKRYLFWWMLVGGISLIPVLHIFYLMVAKVY